MLNVHGTPRQADAIRFASARLRRTIAARTTCANGKMTTDPHALLKARTAHGVLRSGPRLLSALDMAVAMDLIQAATLRPAAPLRTVSCPCSAARFNAGMLTPTHPRATMHRAANGTPRTVFATRTAQAKAAASPLALRLRCANGTPRPQRARTSAAAFTTQTQPAMRTRTACGPTSQVPVRALAATCLSPNAFPTLESASGTHVTAFARKLAPSDTETPRHAMPISNACGIPPLESAMPPATELAPRPTAPHARDANGKHGTTSATRCARSTPATQLDVSQTLLASG